MTSTNNSGSNAGASAGQKVKGAFQAAYGIGESIRGNAMDFVDSALGTERGGHDATVRGTQETETGVAAMKGQHTVPPVGNPDTSNTGPVVNPTATSTAAQSAPLADRKTPQTAAQTAGTGSGQGYTGTGYGPQL